MNVRGTLRSRPNMAAAKASMTSSVRALALIAEPWIGVISTPASAARNAPRAHDAVATRSGRPALSSSRSGSSTTARMETPGRLRLKNSHSASATTPAMTSAATSCHARLTPATLTVRPAPKNRRNSRGSRGVGSQTHVDSARNPSITLTGTTILVTSAVPRRPRITTP